MERGAHAGFAMCSPLTNVATNSSRSMSAEAPVPTSLIHSRVRDVRSESRKSGLQDRTRTCERYRPASPQTKLTKSSGGGNTDNIKLNLYGPALRWMLYEALQYGVRVELSIKGWSPPEHKPSMTRFWRILEVYPFRRLTYKDADSTERWSDFTSVLHLPVPRS